MKLLSYIPIFDFPSKVIGSTTVWYGTLNNAQYMYLFLTYGVEGKDTGLLILKDNLRWGSPIILDMVRGW